MRLVTFAAMAAALGSVGPLQAQTVDQDVKCLMVSNIFSQTEKDEGKRRVATTAALFYLGRVDARVAGPQLRAAMEAQAKTINPASAGPTMTECARTMQGKMAALQAMSKPAAK